VDNIFVFVLIFSDCESAQPLQRGDILGVLGAPGDARLAHIASRALVALSGLTGSCTSFAAVHHFARRCVY